MNDKEYRAFLDLLMCSDPYPVQPREDGQHILEEYANKEAKRRNYKNWLEAYHNVP